MNRQAKINELLTNLRDMFKETKDGIMNNQLLTNEERAQCIINIFILRKNLKLEIIRCFNVHSTNAITDVMNYLLAIDAISQEDERTNPNTRYRINDYAISQAMKVLTLSFSSIKKSEIDLFCGSSDHQESIKN